MHGSFGEIIDQESFYSLLQLADVLQPPLFSVSVPVAARSHKCLLGHPRLCPDEKGLVEGALPLFLGAKLYGYFQGDQRSEGRDDENLTAPILLENLAAKASGALAP